eukprot:gene12774-12902_t
MVSTAIVQATGSFFRYAAASQFGAALASGTARHFSSLDPSSGGSSLRSALASKIPHEQERLRNLKKLHGTKSLGEVTVDQCVGGMRGIPGMLWETSLLDAEEGIRFRGYSIPELQATLPGAKENGEPLPEGLLWLLLTGEVPNKAQVKSLSEDLRKRSALPAHVKTTLEALPITAHPMTQFVACITSLQSRYWEPFYEDTLNLLAKLPTIAAMIYRRTYKGGKYIEADPNLDWAANLSHMMGFDDPNALELMRLYQTIHSDHEGGNVSAHATHLVGSALSDPYLSFAAGMCGLAGPLHGLANQEVLRWIQDVQQELGDNPTKEQLTAYVQATLKSGRVVPGYGHAVLRKTDPRYTCQREFALKHLPNDPLFRLVSMLYEVVPPVLLATGKVKNPWPNVDAHSGVLLQHYGIVEENFYTVLFGVSRAIGVLAQGVWSRALGLPIERPKSLTMELLEQKCATS